MSDVVTRLTCPHCQRVASTTKAVPAGAKAKCPGCGQPFVYQPSPRTADRDEPIAHAPALGSTASRLLASASRNPTSWLYALILFAIAALAFAAGRLTATVQQVSAASVPAGHVPAAMPPPAPIVPEDFTVRVTKAEIGGAYTQKGPFGDLRINSPCLTIYFEMKNDSANRKYDGGGWPTGQLSDEFGNQYRLMTDNHVARPDKIPTTLRPGEALRDVLVFEPPLTQARRLTLELQDHFSSATGPPRSSVAIGIPTADIVNPGGPPPRKRDQ